jgi:ABC-type branched-subunit amino acid transport system substrate-binding protein
MYKGLRIVGAVVATCLVVPACGDDDTSTASTGAAASSAGPSATEATGSSVTESTAGSAPTTAGSATTTGGSTSVPGAGAAPKPNDTPASELGLIDGVYKGTSGFTIDPQDCPEDWDAHQGITDTEIRFMMSLPRSGPLAGFGAIGDGVESYFEYVNSQGGVDGRQLKLDIKDDGYLPDRTKSNVDEAIESRSYAAFSNILGTPNVGAIRDVTEDECMPNLFVATGGPQWGDPENYKFTIGGAGNYWTEAALWANWLQTEHPDLTSIATVTFNNDFGHVYLDALPASIEGTPLKIVGSETHEATEPNLDNQLTSLAATRADVLIIETAAAFCTQALATMERQTAWKPLIILSSACGSPSNIFQPLIDQGLTGADAYFETYYKDVNDPAMQSDPAVVEYQKAVTAQGLDPHNTSYALGWLYGWSTVEALKRAATFQGGLDRGNIMLGARALNENNPMFYPGITTYTDGLKDAYTAEGGQMVQYTVTDKTKLGTLVPVGALQNLEGQLGTYATVDGASALPTGSTPTT